MFRFISNRCRTGKKPDIRDKQFYISFAKNITEGFDVGIRRYSAKTSF
jgi:hypothetical protein